MNISININDFEKIFNFSFTSLREQINDFYSASNLKSNNLKKINNLNIPLIKKIISSNNSEFILNANFINLNEITLNDNYIDFLIAFSVKNEPFVISLNIDDKTIEEINLYYNTNITSYSVPYQNNDLLDIDWNMLSSISKKITPFNALEILNSIDSNELILSFYNQIKDDINYPAILEKSLENYKFLQFVINEDIYSISKLIDLNVKNDYFVQVLYDYLSIEDSNLEDIYSAIHNISSDIRYNKLNDFDSEYLGDSINDRIMDFDKLIYYYHSYINNHYNINIKLT